MLIAVDIDGILTIETEGWGDDIYMQRTPLLTNIQKINTLKKNGHKIILYTARYEEDKNVTLAWLKKNKVKYDQIIFGKLQYDILIDDKARNNFDFLEEG